MDGRSPVRRGREWSGRPVRAAAAVLACLVMGVLVAVTLIGRGLAAGGSVALGVPFTDRSRLAAVVVAAMLILTVGPLVQVDQWVLDLSPFAHVPHLPGSSFTVVPLMILTLIAADLGGAGLGARCRRDLPV